jgi:hypothetical protein
MARLNRQFFKGARNQQPADAERQSWEDVLAAAKERNQRNADRLNQKLLATRATDPVSAAIGPHLTSQALDVGKASYYTDLGDPQALIEGSQEMAAGIKRYAGESGDLMRDIIGPTAGMTAISFGAMMPGLSAKGAKSFSEAAIEALKKGDLLPSTRMVTMAPDEFQTLQRELMNQTDLLTDRKAAGVRAVAKKGFSSVPVIKVRAMPDGTYKVVDTDGAHRVAFLQKEGAQQVPVGIVDEAGNELAIDLKLLRGPKGDVPYADIQPGSKASLITFEGGKIKQEYHPATGEARAAKRAKRMEKQGPVDRDYLAKANQPARDLGFPGSWKNTRTRLAPPAGKGSFKNFATGEMEEIDYPERIYGAITNDDKLKFIEHMMDDDEITLTAKWYRDIMGAFVEKFGPDEGPKRAAPFLIYNRNINPQVAVQMSSQAIEQVRRAPYVAANAPVQQLKGRFPGSDADVKALYQGEPVQQTGQKLSDFLASEGNPATRPFYGNDPAAGPAATADIWTIQNNGFVRVETHNALRRMGYDPGGLNIDVPHSIDKVTKVDATSGIPETLYEWAGDSEREFTDHLNRIGWRGRKDWSSEEVQAIGWSAEGKWQGAQAMSVPEALERNRRDVAFEVASFGEGSPLAKAIPEVQQMSPPQLQAFNDVAAKEAVKIASKRSGIDGTNIVYGTGAWENHPNPTVVAQLYGSPEAASIFADEVGFLAQQTEVWEARIPFMTAKGNIEGRDFAIDLVGDGLGDDLPAIWERVRAVAPDLIQGYQPLGKNGIRVLIRNQPLADGLSGVRINRWVRDTEAAIDNVIGPKLKGIAPDTVAVDFHRADISIHGNKWDEDPAGNGYLKRLESQIGPEAVAALRDTDGPQYSAFLQKEARRILGGQEPAKQALAPAQGLTPDDINRKLLQPRGPPKP